MLKFILHLKSRKEGDDVKNMRSALQILDRTITSDYDNCFKQENNWRIVKILSGRIATQGLIFLTSAMFGIIFAVAGSKFTTGYLCLFFMMAIGIGTYSEMLIASLMLDKIPDFKSCKVLINSNNDVIVQNRPRNRFLTWYLNKTACGIPHDASTSKTLYIVKQD